MEEYKLVIIGNGGVGKSTLTIQFVKNQCVEQCEPIIEDNYRKQVIIDDGMCLLDILDTANLDEYSALRDSWMKTGHGFLLVYSIDSRSSFEGICVIRDQALKLKKDDQVPMILVGNKCDLIKERQVTAEEGQQLARSFGCPFVESSAKMNTNVKSVFFDLVREIKKQHPTQDSSISSSSSNKSCVIS